jgi:diguanylate cyclase (GGDEF)-like protein
MTDVSTSPDRPVVMTLPTPGATILVLRRLTRLGLGTVRQLLLMIVASAVHATLPALPIDDNPLAEPRFASVGTGIIPRQVVAAMAQDRAGFLWIATGNGLVRFDGYQFRPQERESADPATRNLGWIRSLLAGSDGRLWIGTDSDGLAVYDPANESVTTYGSWRGKNGPDATGNGPRNDGAGSVIPTIRALAEDRDGGIWVGSESGGLDRFDPQGERFANYQHTHHAGSLPDNRVRALLVDQQGTLWVGTRAGLSRRPVGSDRFEPVFSDDKGGTDLAGHLVQALFEASDGRIWVGTQEGDLAIIDPATTQGLLLKHAPGGLSQGAVSSIVEAPGGRMWVGRSSGIDLYELRSARLLQRLQHDLRKPEGLAGNEVTTLMLDHSGLIWVGGLGVGLQRTDPNNRSIWLRGPDRETHGHFFAGDARSLLQVDQGEIWVAMHNAGVAVMDPQLRVTGSVRPLPPARVDAMVQALDGTIWLGADSRLYQFSRRHRQIKVLPHGGGLTRLLLAASDGALWVATQDGVFCLRPGASEVVRLRVQGAQWLHADINALAEAPDGSVWVGSNVGVFRVAAGKNELQPVTSPPGAGIDNPNVVGLLFDRQQKLWVDASVSGLHRMRHWDGQHASFEPISVRHGMISHPFGGNLLEDGRGRIWSQMFAYDPAIDRLDKLTAADGADLGIGWFLARTRTLDGRLLFGGSKGILVVTPANFTAAAYAPPLRISALKIDGQQQSAGGILYGLTMTPDKRSFSLEFTALDYSDPGRLRYAYRLEGFDPDWINTAADSRVAAYSNLDPGDYVLRVRGSNRNGAWSPHELAIPVRIEPAWWQTLWFRLLLSSLLAAMIYALVQLRTRHLRSRQTQLQRLVRERTAALEDSSLTDPLTGLRNRRFLAQHIEADLALSVRAYESHLQYGGSFRDDADLIFFLFDIDHFKRVNDEYGHAAGDAVIVQMRARLLRVFRESDYLIRWGGEEFLVVARATSRRYAAELAERARVAIAGQPFELDDGRLLSKTCSIGFCCFPLSVQHPSALGWSVMVNIADAALYAIKNAGRNGWLGALSASGELPAALPLLAVQRPLADWMRSADLQAVCSPDHRLEPLASFSEL